MANLKSRPSTDIPALLLERLTRDAVPCRRICVALSGGVDSVVLLDAAKVALETRANVRLAAVHVHHGLSPHADAWESFCRKLCDRLCVPLEVHRVQVIPDGAGLEAAARKARYAALNDAECDWILLGHHRNDQAETLLLNLLRGAGVHGAAGMAEKRGRLLRPLLSVSREEIVDYAVRNRLSWVEDESNADGRYNRNFLRHQVMPLLEVPFPQAADSLARAASAFADAAELLDLMAKDDLGDQSLLAVSQLRSLSVPRSSNLLAYYLRRHGLQIPSKATLKELLRQLLSADRDSGIRFVIGDREVRRFRDRVYVEDRSEHVSSITWSGEDVIPWGRYRIHVSSTLGGGLVSSAQNAGPLQFSMRRGGEVLQLRQDGPRRPLKDILREAGIPPWRRKTLPVLYSGEDVVWVAGIGVAAKYRCKPGVEGFLIEFDGVTW